MYFSRMLKFINIMGIEDQLNALTRNKIENSSLEYKLLSRPDEIVHCHHCNNDIIPHRIYEPTTTTWLVGGGICLIGCWCGVCLVPLFSDSFKVATVFCSYCSKIISSGDFSD
jgi:LITAF-like zinc ribbon domain